MLFSNLTCFENLFININTLNPFLMPCKTIIENDNTIKLKHPDSSEQVALK